MRISRHFQLNADQAELDFVDIDIARDMDLLLARCRDTLKDGRGLVIPLVDDDLVQGLRERGTGLDSPLEDRLDLLQRRLALTGM
jgi:hypothetical protein